MYKVIVKYLDGSINGVEYEDLETAKSSYYEFKNDWDEIYGIQLIYISDEGVKLIKWDGGIAMAWTELDDVLQWFTFSMEEEVGKHVSNALKSLYKLNEASYPMELELINAKNELSQISFENDQNNFENHVSSEGTPNYYVGVGDVELYTVIDWFTRNMNGGQGFKVGNVMKYLFRMNAKHSHPYKDVKKAERYVDMLISENAMQRC